MAKRYGPIVHEELYGIVPEKLWQFRHGTLINCAKIKGCIFAGGVFFSLALKNLFGLIPVPDRMEYHGAGHTGLSRTIIDMNQIYGSIFKVISILESLHATLLTDRGTYDDPSALVEDLAFAAASDNTLELDAFMVRALGGSPNQRHFLRMGAELFGQWDQNNFPTLPPTVAQRLQTIMTPQN